MINTVNSALLQTHHLNMMKDTQGLTNPGYRLEKQVKIEAEDSW